MTFGEFIGVVLSCGSGFVMGFLLAADHYANYYQERERNLKRGQSC